jgi:hypothetical protein
MLNSSRVSPQTSTLCKATEEIALAARLERALVPVAPAPEFRERLRYGLRMAAYHREVYQLLVQPRAEMPWSWLVGAAALGSAAGLLTLLLRTRLARVDTTLSQTK